MKGTILRISILSLVLMISSCHNTPWDPDVEPSLPPNIFYFQIKKDGVKLADSILSKTILYYYIDGRYVANPDDMDISEHSPDLTDSSFIFIAAERCSSVLDNTGVMCSGYIDNICSYGANTMYLKYPNGNTDTLYIEIGNLEYKEAIKDRCYCEHPFTKVMFNGKIAPEATDLHPDDGRPVFVFEK